MGLKWIKKDEFVIHQDCLKDVIENGVIHKSTQQYLSHKTGIAIKQTVGRPKKK